MRKVIFVFTVCAGLAFATTSCNTMKSASSVASLAGFNVNSITSGVMGTMTNSLGLTNSQQPLVTNIVSNFLTQKSGIIGLQQSDPVKYASKVAPMLGGLKSKLDGVLTAAQMVKLMGMKPQTNDVTNVMSNLFF